MYGEAFLKKVTSLGILGYPLKKCLNVLEVRPDETDKFCADFNNPESDLAKAYFKGRDQADYAIDIGLFNKAKEGDIEALNRYEERMEERRSRGE